MASSIGRGAMLLSLHHRIAQAAFCANRLLHGCRGAIRRAVPWWLAAIALSGAAFTGAALTGAAFTGASFFDAAVSAAAAGTLVAQDDAGDGAPALPMRLAQAPAAPMVIGIGVRGLPAVTHVPLQPSAPFASSSGDIVQRGPGCGGWAGSSDMATIALPALPRLALPSLSLPPLCAVIGPKPGMPSVPAASLPAGAPCPAESFERLPDTCAFQGGDSFVLRQSPWLWSSNSLPGSIGMPVVLQVFRRSRQ